jgi:hypothetical protein
MVGTSKNKGLRTLLKSNPTPCESKTNQHRQKKHNPWTDLCLWTLKNRDKMRNLGDVGFVREKKMGKYGSERRADGGGVVARWWHGHVMRHSEMEDGGW